MTEGQPDAGGAPQQPDYARRQRVALVTLLVLGLGTWGLVSALGGGSHRRSARPSSRVSLLDALAPDLQQSSGGSLVGTHVTLPLGRAVAQLFLVGFGGTDPHAPFFARLRQRDWGGVVLDRANFVNTTQLRALTAQVVNTAAAAGHTAPWVAVRQPGGDESALPGLPPAPETDVGASGDPARARSEAVAAARALRSLRVNMNLAPDADLAYQGGVALARGFGTDPATVAQLSTAAIDGYRHVGVVAVLGHFPGEGAASQDPQTGPATVGLSLADLRARDLLPFAVAAGSTSAIQMSDALFTALDPVTPASLSPAALGLLRQGLRYTGIVVSGDLVAAAADGGVSVGEAAVAALRAGEDLLYVPGDPANQEQAYSAVLRALRDGRLPGARVAEAVGRLLTLKRAYGLIG